MQFDHCRMGQSLARPAHPPRRRNPRTPAILSIRPCPQDAWQLRAEGPPLRSDEESAPPPITTLTSQLQTAFSPVALLKERGYSYLINITRDRRRKYAEQFAQDGFEAHRPRCRASDSLPAARYRLESSLPRAENLGKRGRGFVVPLETASRLYKLSSASVRLELNLSCFGLTYDALNYFFILKYDIYYLNT